MEAFSDGVLAIIITIMVLEIKVPHGAEPANLVPLIPVFISYVLSFVYIGLYWNNHHHLFQAVDHVNGKILWANIHLLFWLSLLPFATGWMGENHFSQWPVIVYGVVLLMCSIAYFIMVRFLIVVHPKESALVKAIGNDKKGKISCVIYLLAILLSFVNAWIGIALYFFVAAIWFFPDTRIEKRLESEP
ncbi:MAG: Integral rane protein [Ferruginibacter sp.]|nr:Integral rane protein [Ferruginibacter sp.]